MPGIPDNLYLRLRAALMEVDEFADDDTLRNVMQNSRLRPWRNRLRDTANRATRAEGAIAYLQNQYSRDPRENALVVLLRTLAGRREPENAEHLELEGLAAELERTQTGPVPIATTPSLSDEDGAEKTSMPIFNQRGQHVGQQYNVAGDLHIGAVQSREANATRETVVPPPVDVVIITPLEEERDAVLAKLNGHRQLPPAADDIRVYFSAELPVTFPDGATASYRVIVVPLLNMGRIEAANATGDAIRRWRPRYVCLVGIAGGLAKAGVALGDVLIADQIADYELQKLTPEATSIRWQVHRVDQRLLGAARNLRGDGWHRLITCARPDAGQPRRHIGAICTGDKVIANGLLNDYQEVWAKLVGVEMEAGGTASAAFQAPNLPGFFMVRGVSDLADAAKDAGAVQQWRAYACDVAAAYAIGLLQSGPVPLVRVEGEDRPQ